jgi:archaellum component FlaF (FlaF/FlaG flagellin family)
MERRVHAVVMLLVVEITRSTIYCAYKNTMDNIAERAYILFGYT